MNKSDNINELATALCNAQAQMGGAVKDAKNPFFKSSYADLTSVIKAIKQPFSDNGLSYIQFPISSEDAKQVGVRTVLMHISGQWLEDVFMLPVIKADPQSAASCITYARRYGLQSVAGIPTADDDGEASMLRNEKPDTKLFESLLWSQDASAFMEYWNSLDEETQLRLFNSGAKGRTTKIKERVKYIENNWHNLIAQAKEILSSMANEEKFMPETFKETLGELTVYEKRYIFKSLPSVDSAFLSRKVKELKEQEGEQSVH